MLANKSIIAGLSAEPGASNIIGDIMAMNPPMAIAGMPRIVSMISHVRTGRFWGGDVTMVGRIASRQYVICIDRRR